MPQSELLLVFLLPLLLELLLLNFIEIQVFWLVSQTRTLSHSFKVILFICSLFLAFFLSFSLLSLLLFFLLVFFSSVEFNLYYIFCRFYKFTKLFSIYFPCRFKCVCRTNWFHHVDTFLDDVFAETSTPWPVESYTNCSNTGMEKTYSFIKHRYIPRSL